MGLFDEMFGAAPPPEPASHGLFDSLFGGFSPSRSESHVPFGGYSEPIMPAASQARGYGGQMFGSFGEADKSRLMSGVVTDPDTGYVGTPAEIYDRYKAEGRDPRPLVARFHRY